MADSRHFTVVDDWVMLNPDVTATEYRVYSIIKGNLKHTYGGIPESGFRATAAWVCTVSGGIVAVSTAHKAMQGLAKKGVLRRLNNPQSGEGADFEFVIVPNEEYEGPRSVMAKASEIGKVKSRSVVFVTVPLDRSPRSRRRAEDAKAPDLRMAGPERSEEPETDPVDSGVASAPGEFDFSGLDGPPPRTLSLTAEQREFAAELEAVTSQNSEEHLRMTAGACRRVAEAMRPVLERGWEPGVLAGRLAAELNPKVRMPEKLLASKADDFGQPPPKPDPTGEKVMFKGRMVDLGSYDLGFGHADTPREMSDIEPVPSSDDEGTRERLARLAKKSKRY